MQKTIRVFSVLIFLMYLNDIRASEMQLSVDTTIKTLVTLKEYPITHLASITDVRLQKDDPKQYYGSWQWVNHNGDRFIIHIQPYKEELDKSEKPVKADIICHYRIVRQGKLVELDSGQSKESFLYGFTAEKKLLLAPAECKIEQLDQSCFFVFQFASNNHDIANLKRGSQLPFFVKVFNKQSDNHPQTIPMDIIMKKIFASY